MDRSVSAHTSSTGIERRDRRSRVQFQFIHPVPIRSIKRIAGSAEERRLARLRRSAHRVTFALRSRTTRCERASLLHIVES